MAFELNFTPMMSRHCIDVNRTFALGVEKKEEGARRDVKTEGCQDLT